MGPTLLTFGDPDSRLLVAWKGMDDDQRMWYTTNVPNGWANQTQVPGVASSIGPTMALNGSENIIFAWKGEDSDVRIWWTDALYSG